MKDSITIATWNLKARTGKAAAKLGLFLADQGGADLVLLQEASVEGLRAFRKAAGLGWGVHVREDYYDLLRVRGAAGQKNEAGEKNQNRRGVAVAGRGDGPAGVTAFPEMPLPEKVMAAWVRIGRRRTTLVTYHSPNAADYHERKAEQAVRLARWLKSVDGPVILGGDFNTPGDDPPDFTKVRVGWPTGKKELAGQPGEDVLVGAEPDHDLKDAYRTYLRHHPKLWNQIKKDQPEGPLKVSHYTDRKRTGGYRYDAIWLSDHFKVQHVEYVEGSLDVGTDHALVPVTAKLKPRSKGKK